MTYSIIKTLFFAFIITSVSAFQGYFVDGGSLEVGRASTKAVVFSSVLILLVQCNTYPTAPVMIRLKILISHSMAISFCMMYQSHSNPARQI